MIDISISKTIHRGEERIKLEFPFCAEVNNCFKQLPFIQYSATMRCWHLSYSEKSIVLLQKYQTNKFLIKNADIFINREFKNYDIEKRDLEIYSKEEIQRLIGSNNNLKDKLLISLLYSCGLRKSEVLNIELKHISKESKSLTIVNKYSTTDRTISLSSKIVDMLILYYKKCKPERYLFESTSGQPISSIEVSHIFKIALGNANISRNMGVNSLRHSFAVHLFNNGTELETIKTILGHSNNRVTKKYLGSYFDKKRSNPFDSFNV